MPYPIVIAAEEHFRLIAVFRAHSEGLAEEWEKLGVLEGQLAEQVARYRLLLSREHQAYVSDGDPRRLMVVEETKSVVRGLEARLEVTQLSRSDLVKRLVAKALSIETGMSSAGIYEAKHAHGGTDEAAAG